MAKQETASSGAGISRRSLLRWGASSAIMLPFVGALSACGDDSSAAPAATGAASKAAKKAKEIVYVGYGGSPQEATTAVVLDTFTAKTGIPVTGTTGASDIAKFRAMVEAGKTTWDTVEVTTPIFSQLVKEGLIDKMDYSVVPREGYQDPRFVNDFAVPQYYYSHCIFWNTERIPGGMSTWADVWNVKKFPGKRAFQKKAYYLFEAALLADGVAPADLYPMDVDRALRKIEEIKDHLIFQDLNTIQNLVAQGDVVTGDLGLTRVQTLIKDKVPLKYTWDENIVDAVRWVIPKGSPNPEGTAELIKHTVDPQIQLDLLEKTGFTPSTSAALSKLPASERADLPGTEETLPTSAALNMEWYAEHGQEAQKALDEWLLKL